MIELEKEFLIISHGQIAVLDLTITDQFNDWSRRHSGQGFSWRRGSVSFRPILGGGVTELEVEIVTGAKFKLNPNTERAILVPFTVTGPLEIASVVYTYSGPLNIAPGEYRLIFENRVISQVPERMWSRITFVSERTHQAQILRADPLLFPEYPLLMEAQPA